jgi:hypothetical protein
MPQLGAQENILSFLFTIDGKRYVGWREEDEFLGIKDVVKPEMYNLGYMIGHTQGYWWFPFRSTLSPKEKIQNPEIVATFIVYRVTITTGDVKFEIEKVEEPPNTEP